MESTSQESIGNQVSVQAKFSEMSCDDAQMSIIMAKNLESFDSGTYLQSELSTPTYVQKLTVGDLRQVSPTELGTSYKDSAAVSSSLSNHLKALNQDFESHQPHYSNTNVQTNILISKSTTSSYKIPTAISNSLSNHLLALNEEFESHQQLCSKNQESPSASISTMHHTNATDRSFLEVQQLTERVSGLIEENSTNMETLRRTEDKLDYSQGQLTVKESEILKLKKELKLKQSENEQLIEKVISKDMESDMLQDKVNESQKQLQEASEALFIHSQKANDLVESYRMQSASDNRLLAEEKQALADEKQALEDEKQALLDEKQALSTENADLKTKLKGTADLLQQLEAERQQKEGDTLKALKAAQGRITDLLQELDQNRAKVQSMEEQMEKMIEEDSEKENNRNDQMQLLEVSLMKMKNEWEEELQRVTNNWKAAENKVKDFQTRIETVANQHGVEAAASDSTTSQGKYAPAQKLAEIDLCLAKKDAYIKRLEAEKNELSDAVHKNDLLEIEIATQKRNAKSENLRQVELETLCETLQKANQDLNEKAGEYSERVNQLQTECESLESRLNERTAQLIANKEVKKSAEEIERKMKEKDDEIRRLGDETEVLTRTTEDLSVKLTSLENELATKDMCVNTQKEHLTTLTAQHRTAMQQMKAQHDQNLRIHAEKHQQMKSDAEQLARVNQQLREKIAQLSKDLSTSLNEVELLEQELVATRTVENNNAKCHNMALQNLQDMATNDTKRVQILELELNTCKAQLNTHIEQIEAMQNEYKNNLTSKNNQISELESQIRICSGTLDEEIENKKLLEQSLKDRMSIVKQMNDRVLNLEDIKESLEMELSVVNAKTFNSSHNMREMREMYKTRLINMEQDVQLKDGRIVELMRQLRTNEQEMSSLKETLEYQAQQINDCILEKEESVMRIELLESELAETKNQLHQQIESAEALKNDLQDSIHARNGADQSCKELETQLLQLQSNYEELERKYQLASEQSKTTVVALSDRADQLSDLEEQKRELQHELEDKDKELYESQVKLEEQQHEMSLRNEQVAQMTVRIAQFQSEKEIMVCQLRQRVNEMKEDIASRVEEMSVLDKELNLLRKELQETRQKLEEKNGDCTSLTEEVKEKEVSIDRLKQLLESKEASITRDLQLSRDREQNSEARVTQCRNELEVLYTQLNKVRSESNIMANCIFEKEKRVDQLEANIKELKKEKSHLEKKYKNEFIRIRNQTQNQMIAHQEELEKLKAHNHFLLQKSSEHAMQGNEKFDKQRSEIKKLRNELVDKEEDLQSFKSKVKRQEETVVKLKEHIMKLEDDKAERSLLASCRANIKEELFSSSWTTDDTAASISEFTDMRSSAKEDLRFSTSSNFNAADGDENSASLVESDLDNSLCRRIFGPIQDDEVQGFSSLEGCSHDQASLKEMQKEYIASKFRM